MLFHSRNKKTSFQKKAGFYSIRILLIISFMSMLLYKTTVEAAPRVQETGDKTVIVIDPGHGGENNGTIENGVLEKAMNMTTALAMYEELLKYEGIEVYLTHTDDIDMSLRERAEFAADKEADFLFSIHYNASVDHDLFGTEVWIPAFPPYNAYGYQFGYLHMQHMQEMGLFIRGVKTKLNSKGTEDYYGIIRESAELNIPAVIIEHCHVDEERDYHFCDSEEDLIAFGKADALAVAKYFGLKSTVLEVDYSDDAMALQEVQEGNRVHSTMKDESAPDVCMVTLLEKEEDTGLITLEISAADYDSPLIYFDYSIDNGHTFSKLQPWPQSDALTGTYQDTFEFELQIPSGMQPNIIVRAYNLFDAVTASEKLPIWHIFRYGEQYERKPITETTITTDKKEENRLPGTTGFMPAVSDEAKEEIAENKFFLFLKISLVIVLFVFLIVLLSAFISNAKRRKKRRQRRKDSGNKFDQRR